ncbi:MAG: DsbA family protein, partial [Polyangiales bacterium]
MTMLKPPVGPNDHVRGRDDAPVTLLEYGDYECPYCGEAYPIVASVLAQAGGGVRFVFRNFPLSESHPHALVAARAAESAGAQDSYWAMHDTLYEHQHALEEQDLFGYAEALGLDMTRFAEDMRDER